MAVRHERHARAMHGVEEIGGIARVRQDARDEIPDRREMSRMVANSIGVHRANVMDDAQLVLCDASIACEAEMQALVWRWCKLERVARAIALFGNGPLGN